MSRKPIASKTGAKKKRSDDAIFNSIVKQDPKSKKFIFKVETASGKHEFEKNSIDTMKFVDLMNKKYGRTGLKSIQSKNKDLKGNAKQQLTYMKQWMKIISESKDIATDKQIHDWMGVSGNILNDLQSGGTMASQKKSKSSNNEESKQNDANQLLHSSQSQEVEQWKSKYQQAQQAIEQLKAEKDTILRQSQQKEAELRSQLAQARSDYEQLESKYDVCYPFKIS